MKTTYIYYPGLAIAIILLILNVNLVWVFVSLVLGWFSVVENWKKDEPSIVVWFPLIRKFLKRKKNESI
jgi:hypothetical protein